MSKLWSMLLVTLFSMAELSAQMYLGRDVGSSVEMVNASTDPTNAEAKLDGSGTGILIGNGFGVYLIVEIWSESGELLFSTTVAPNNVAIGSHYCPPGCHEVRCCDAGNPPPKKCGTVSVQ
jgi:hypothetical protein